MDWPEAAIRWYLVLLLSTWAFAPLVRWLCRSLSDRGATIARPLAMLFLVYPAWLLASLGIAPYTSALLAVTLVIAAVAGWLLVVRRDGIDREWLRKLVVTEMASLVAFAAYLWLRGYSPAIVGTEKPMDVAFLASSALTTQVPPPDPWFAGEPINYYYLGYLLHGAIARLAAVPPQFAFNLALATIFSTTVVAAFGLAWNVLRPALTPRLAVSGGLLAAFFLTVAGNAYAPQRLLQDPASTWTAWWWDSATGIGWRSSRIVCDGPRTGNLCEAPSVATINEFPFFSFLLGDLHPHLMALPFTLVLLALAWNLANGSRPSAGDPDHARDDPANEPSGRGQRSLSWLRLAITGAVAGALYPLNAWDFPTFLLIAALGVFVTAATVRIVWRPLLVLVASSIVAWLPFWLAYDPPTRTADSDALLRLPGLTTLTSTIGLHLGERTSAGEYLTIFGVPYCFGLVFVVWSSLRATDSLAAEGPRLATIAIVATLIPGVLLSAPVIPLCGIPLILALRLLRRRLGVSPASAVLALLAIAWALSIGVEILYIRDAFGNRMNTLFKFYYQIWTFYALAAAVAVPLLWSAFPRRSPQRFALAAAGAAALLAGLAYPVVASRQWTDGFAAWRGLDGLAYAEATNPDDVAAIRWLQTVSQPGDVVLEAAGCAYRPLTGDIPFNRISAFTGVPAIIGWGDNHQRQWRAGQPELIDQIREREGDVAALYAEPDSSLADAYGVTWLIVGDYESGDWQRECPTAGPYPGIDAPGFPGPAWEEAFRSGDTRVYRRAAP